MSGWRGAVWEVAVFKGLPMGADRAEAPLTVRDTPTVTVGSDGTSEPFHPVAYGPVCLSSWDGHLIIQIPEMSEAEIEKRLVEQGGVTGGWEDVRVMLGPTYDFDSFAGEILVTGAEVARDGSLVYARWIVRPYRRSD